MPLSLAEPQAASPDRAAPPQVSQGGAARALYAAVTLLVLLAALLHRALLGSPPVFPVDDAYITLHNAQVLHWRHDPNFAGTPALAGATSAVHLALVALLMFALSPPVALWAALWLAALAYTLGLVIPPLGALAHPASSRAGTAASRVRRVNLGGAAVSRIARAGHTEYLVVLVGWDGIFGLSWRSGFPRSIGKAGRASERSCLLASSKQTRGRFSSKGRW